MAARRTMVRVALLALVAGACAEAPPDPAAPVLVFAGPGTNQNDVAAVEALLRADSLRYATVSARQLDAMDEAALRAHRLLIVPGGNFIDMGNGLAPATLATVRTAVSHGLNYLGLCAGAFLAADGAYRSFNLTNGVRFGFYEAERRGIRKAAVLITAADSSRREHYWEDGPALSGWGDVVARYPDGSPAIVQGHAGSGWVTLSGVHPEAPESWRRGMTFATPASEDQAYARRMIGAALRGTPLPHD